MSRKLVLIGILAVLLTVCLWVITKRDVQRLESKESLVNSPIAPKSNTEASPLSTEEVQENREPSPPINDDGQRVLSSDELEKLKLTDYHAYIKYKANNGSTIQSELTSENQKSDSEKKKELIKKKLLEHLHKSNDATKQ